MTVDSATPAVSQGETQFQTLNAQQALALPMLVSGQRYEAVAKSVGVALGTVKNWCSSNADFKAALQQLRSELHADSIEQWNSLRYEASQALRDIVVDPNVLARDKIAAARVVFGVAPDVKPTVKAATATARAAESIAQILKGLEHGEI